jgi:ribosomal protein L11 methyltransferase
MLSSENRISVFSRIMATPHGRTCSPPQHDTIPGCPFPAGDVEPGCASPEGVAIWEEEAGMSFRNAQDPGWVEPFIEHQGEQRGLWLRKPRAIGEKLLIARNGSAIPAPWKERTTVFLDFRSAFGTGGHGTTEGCLVEMEKFIRGGERVLDVGTGTGILAIAARKLGAAQVTAVDIDRGACEETGRNLAMNGISGGVVVVQGGIRSVADRYDIVVANLRTPVLAGIVGDLAGRLDRSGIAILSGILERELHPFLSLLGEYLIGTPEIRRVRGWMTLASRMRGVT